MVALVRRSPSGDFQEIETSIAPLSALMWVDPDTDVPTEDQTGSIGAPYATVQQAHDALPANGGTIVVCFSADEVSAGPLVATKSIGLQGFGQGAEMDDIESTSDVYLNAVVASNVTLTGGNLRLIEAQCTAIDAGAGSVNLFDSIVSDSIVAGQLTARDSQLTSGNHVIETLVTSQNSVIGPMTVTAGDIVSQGDTWNSAVSAAAGTITAQGSTFEQGGLAFATLDLKDCTIGGDPDTEVIDGGAASFDDCTIGLPITSSGSVSLKDCSFDGGEANLAIVSAGGICINTRLIGDWDAGPELQTDTFSYYAASSVGHDMTSLNTTFLDASLSITLSVVVPAVAADAVGYVDTTLVGTALEGFFAVGDPVVVNPTTDLVAAGAGGGLLNARISAANTLRCAFVGALAGGAADFTVSRAR